MKSLPDMEAKIADSDLTFVIVNQSKAFVKHILQFSKIYLQL